MLTVIFLALGLSMDAVAVSLVTGIARPDVSFWRSMRMPAAFGFFQALMPLLGWLGGSTFVTSISLWGHWLACALLVGIGGKMVWEALTDDDQRQTHDPFAWGRLLLLSLATSIDAAAAGISIALIGLPVAVSILIIGVTTTVLCIPALLLANRLGARWATGAEISGGLVLIFIGIITVVEQLRS